MTATAALRRCALALFAAAASPLSAHASDPEPDAEVAPPAASTDEGVRGEFVTLGYLEDVRVGNLGLEMKGKLDTGADTSSVYARDIELYDRKGKDTWVRFRLIGKDGRSIRYDQNVIRFVRIKQKRGGRIRRPVIHLPLCVGGKSGVAEINLADRSDFEFDILVGREFLAHRIAVDSSRTYASKNACLDAREEEDAITVAAGDEGDAGAEPGE